MFRVEATLSAWKKLYLELGEAQDRLKAAREQSLSPEALERCKAEVVRLQAESNAALEAVHAEIARFKKTSKEPPAEPSHPG